MNLECLSGIIKDGLAIHIDITDEKSWNLNTGFTSVSLNQWSGAYSDNINLYDFGLTAFDNGRVNDVISSLNITPEDLKVSLYRVGNNNATGGTFYDSYSISAVTSASTVGNYFDLDGGYLQGFFKLEDYNHELLPQRYNEGITIETLINIGDNSEGIFYLMGARSEDKYNPFFSGETKEVIKEETVFVRTGVIGFTRGNVVTTLSFSGVTTSEDNNLNAFLNETKIKNAFIDYEDRNETKLVEQPRDSINENVIAFGLNSDGRIYIKRVDEVGIVRTLISPNVLTVTGWTMINISFKPYKLLNHFDEIIECAPARSGDLNIYVDGRKFWKIEKYKEFFFLGMKNNKEKQIGVPYNISWGGGSFGLKHSYHWDLSTTALYDNQDTLYINDNFISKVNPLKDDPCGNIIDIGVSGISDVIFSADTQTFGVNSECDPTNVIDEPTFRIENTGTTAQTTGQQYYFEFNSNLEIISNRDYDITLSLFENNIFRFGSTKEIKLVVYGSEDIEVIEEKKYDGRFTNQWVNLKLKVKVKDNTGRQTIRIGLLINSNQPLEDNFILFLNDFNYSGSNILLQDDNKDNLTIENNFNSSYTGLIQKLRVYTIPFTAQMALHNAIKELNSNTGYGKIIRGGGRIIYR
jgi:hypothetical protein